MFSLVLSPPPQAMRTRGKLLSCLQVLILKAKEVAPHTGTAVTNSFWKEDLKTTQEYFRGHMI